MKGFKLSPEAARDVREIWAHIAQDDIKAARRVRLQIFHACQSIAENPRIDTNERTSQKSPCGSGRWVLT